MARRDRIWGFDDEARTFLIEVTSEVPALRALVTRAERRADLGMWVVRASLRELDEMYSFGEALMETTRSRRRLDLLEGMLASLCTSMDGF
jgi:hypothetical protein